MSGWDSAGPTTGGGEWDGGAAATTGGDWNDGYGGGVDTGFGGSGDIGFGDDNANGAEGGARSGGCFNCGQEYVFDHIPYSPHIDQTANKPQGSHEERVHRTTQGWRRRRGMLQLW